MFKQLIDEVIKRAAAIAVHEHRALSMTVAALLAALAAGFYVLPGGGGKLTTFEIPDATASPRHLRLAVFSLEAGGIAARVGDAKLVADTALQVHVYDAGIYQRSAPVLLQADAKLLWTMASNDNKREMRAKIGDFAGSLRDSLAKILTSNTFHDKYQTPFQTVVWKAIDASLRDPKLDQKVADIRFVEKVFDNEFVVDYLSQVAKNTGRNFLTFVDRILRPDDHEAVGARFRSVFSSPEIQRMFAERINRLARSQEAVDLTLEFGRSFLTNLSNDPEFWALIGSIAANPAFADEFAMLEQSSIETAKQIAKLLVGVDRKDRMHPVAATIVRSLLLEEAQWLVAFGTPDQISRLNAALPKGVVRLMARPSP